ncbi:MAG TPA: DUF1592 domain-containing protein, partial [Verrucomicrobiae bacterium]
MPIRFVASALLSLAFCGGSLALSPQFEKKNTKNSWEKDIQPLLSEYCYSCHGGGKKKGDLALDVYTNAMLVVQDRKTWEKVLDNVSKHVMPPEHKKQPSNHDRDRLTKWILSEVFQCDCSKPDPGRVTIRRLNRTEYNNTIRDLTGIDFEPAEDFPQDDTGYGFDNIGDVLSLSPVLFEKYMAAAQRILDSAIVTNFTPRARTNVFEAIILQGTASSGDNGEGMRTLFREGDVHVSFNFPEEAEYTFRVRAYGEQAGPDPARMALLLDDKEIERFDVTAVHAKPRFYEVKLKTGPGKHKLAAAYLNNYVNNNHPDRKMRGDRNLVVDYLTIISPPPTKPLELPESHRRIIFRKPIAGKESEAAQEIVARFTKLAWRRPVTKPEVDRVLGFYEMARKDGANFEGGIKLALEAVLVSPNFLFRGELQSPSENALGVTQINEFALASRLSYFLWSTMPDETLLADAERGVLRKNMDKQIERMLKHPRAQALVDNFASQWLQFRSLASLTPDKKTFPDFDDDLRAAMEKETELFFANIIKEDRSLLDFLSANYSFINARLARHYGIKGVTGDDFRRVSLEGTPRGGILTHASILTLTSNPTRTSPVKRGKWVLENLLGAPPPPPPPNVP